MSLAAQGGIVALQHLPDRYHFAVSRLQLAAGSADIFLISGICLAPIRSVPGWATQWPQRLHRPVAHGREMPTVTIGPASVLTSDPATDRKRIAKTAQHLDLFATIVVTAGGAMPADRPMDSFNLVDFSQRRELTFWRPGDCRVVRAGTWRLRVVRRPERVWLFNRAIDPTERFNLAARHLSGPLWPGLLEAPIRVDVPLNAPGSKDQEFVYWTN